MMALRFGAALALSLSLVACGDTGSEAPLSLDERVVGAAEAPGSEPDPEETPVTVTGLEELEDELDGPEVFDEDIQALGDAGFISAVFNTRFFPSEEGGEHAPGTPHVFTVVSAFESDDGANEAVDIAHRIGLRPCPETCAYEIAEFEPAGVPDAKGVEAVATQEAIDEIGDDIQPDARYSIYFADGPIAYEVTVFGRPDDVSRQQAEEIAQKLYERVSGAPLP
ncbi:MAG TPA: hypothetical protein VFP30_04100 [Candidatus Limnocylindria bacterium]|nr:hypothetical protein [Candidatus Limnocylindria bacterium]